MEVARSCLYLFSLHMFCMNELDATLSTRIDSHNTAKKHTAHLHRAKKSKKMESISSVNSLLYATRSETFFLVPCDTHTMPFQWKSWPLISNYTSSNQASQRTRTNLSPSFAPPFTDLVLLN